MCTFQPFRQLNLVSGDFRGGFPENFMVNISDFRKVSKNVERIKTEHCSNKQKKNKRLLVDMWARLFEQIFATSLAGWLLRKFVLYNNWLARKVIYSIMVSRGSASAFVFPLKFHKGQCFDFFIVFFSSFWDLKTKKLGRKVLGNLKQNVEPPIRVSDCPSPRATGQQRNRVSKSSSPLVIRSTGPGSRSWYHWQFLLWWSNNFFKIS